MVRHVQVWIGFVFLISLGACSGWGEKTSSDNTVESEAESTEPKLYIVSMMHVEENLPFDTDNELFTRYEEALRRVSLKMKNNGAKIDIGPDWKFLDGVNTFESDVLDEITDFGHGIHTHAHETLYDLQEVNQKLRAIGISNKIANGGFLQDGPGGENWVGYIADFTDASGANVFDAIIGYKNPTTQIPDSTGIILRPTLTGEDWKIHDPSGPIIFVGSNMPEEPSAGALDFETIQTIVNDALGDLNPDEINTLYWHDSLHQYSSEAKIVERLRQWEALLNDYFKPLVESGQVEWATFAEMVELYKDHERSK